MLERFTTTDRLCAGGAAATILSCFLGWFSYSTATTHVSVNGFRAGLFADLVYLAAVATLVLVLARTEVLRLPMRLPVGDRVALLITGGTALAGTLLQVAVGTSGAHGFGFGPLLSIAGAVTVLAGARGLREVGHHRG